MPSTPVINVDVAGNFDAFMQQFNQYFTQLNQTNQTWNQTNITINNITQSMQVMNNTVNQFSRSTRAVVSTLGGLSKSLLQPINALLGVTGISLTFTGIEQLMRSVVQTQRIASGMGMTFGQYTALTKVSQDFLASGAMTAENLTQARFNIRSPQRRAFINLFGQGAEGELAKGPDAAFDFLDRASKLLSQQPEGLRGPLADSLKLTTQASLGEIMAWGKQPGETEKAFQERHAEARRSLTEQKKAAEPAAAATADFIKLGDRISEIETKLRTGVIVELDRIIKSFNLIKFAGHLEEGQPRAVVPTLLGTMFGGAAVSGILRKMGLGGLGRIAGSAIGGPIIGLLIGALVDELMPSPAGAGGLPANQIPHGRKGLFNYLGRRKALDEGRLGLAGQISTSALIAPQEQLKSTNRLVKAIDDLNTTFKSWFGLGGRGEGGAAGGGGGGDYVGINRGASRGLRRRGGGHWGGAGVTLGGEKTPGGWWTVPRMQHAVDRLTKEAGLSEIGAEGLVARWSGIEASGGPESHNWSPGRGGPGHFGIGQWERARGGFDVWHKGFDPQLDLAIKEFKTTEWAAAERLRTAKTPEEAAVGASMYERAEHYHGGVDDFTARTPVRQVHELLHQHIADAVKKAIPSGPAPGEHHWGPWHAGGSPTNPIIPGRSSGATAHRPRTLDISNWQAPDRGPRVAIHNRTGSDVFINASLLATT